MKLGDLHTTFEELAFHWNGVRRARSAASLHGVLVGYHWATTVCDGMDEILGALERQAAAFTDFDPTVEKAWPDLVPSSEAERAGLAYHLFRWFEAESSRTSPARALSCFHAVGVAAGRWRTTVDEAKMTRHFREEVLEVLHRHIAHSLALRQLALADPPPQEERGASDRFDETRNDAEPLPATTIPDAEEPTRAHNDGAGDESALAASFRRVEQAQTWTRLRDALLAYQNVLRLPRYRSIVAQVEHESEGFKADDPSHPPSRRPDDQDGLGCAAFSLARIRHFLDFRFPALEAQEDARRRAVAEFKEGRALEWAFYEAERAVGLQPDSCPGTWDDGNEMPSDDSRAEERWEESKEVGWFVANDVRPLHDVIVSELHGPAKAKLDGPEVVSADGTEPDGRGSSNSADEIPNREDTCGGGPPSPDRVDDGHQGGAPAGTPGPSVDKGGLPVTTAQSQAPPPSAVLSYERRTMRVRFLGRPVKITGQPLKMLVRLMEMNCVEVPQVELKTLLYDDTACGKYAIRDKAWQIRDALRRALSDPSNDELVALQRAIEEAQQGAQRINCGSDTSPDARLAKLLLEMVAIKRGNATACLFLAAHAVDVSQPVS